MKLQNITINNIGCIKNIVLGNLNPSMNVMTGPNGVGKTTLLKAIYSLLASANRIHLTRNSLSHEGEVSGSLLDGETIKQKSLKIKAFIPDDHDADDGFGKFKDVIYISDNREFNYITLNSIPRDVIKSDYDLKFMSDLTDPINPKEIKGWFINRFLFSAQPNSLSESQIANFELAKNAFSYLDSSVHFSTVQGNTLDIILDTSFGPIYFEYLSSGFKSLTILILSIIKEIEFRLADSNVNVKEFDGIIIIDEVDIHLHPTWQTKILDVLKKTFPNVQFFVSTHSPHVIQSLSSEQLIALEKVDGNIVRRELSTNGNGYRGWTIEEILRDIMGMESTDTVYFQSLWERFTKAIENDDSQIANESGNLLLEMLHPDNVLRKVINLQLTSLSND